MGTTLQLRDIRQARTIAADAKQLDDRAATRRSFEHSRRVRYRPVKAVAR